MIDNDPVQPESRISWYPTCATLDLTATDYTVLCEKFSLDPAAIVGEKIAPVVSGTSVVYKFVSHTNKGDMVYLNAVRVG